MEKNCQKWIELSIKRMRVMDSMCFPTESGDKNPPLLRWANDERASGTCCVWKEWTNCAAACSAQHYIAEACLDLLLLVSVIFCHFLASFFVTFFGGPSYIIANLDSDSCTLLLS